MADGDFTPNEDPEEQPSDSGFTPEVEGMFMKFIQKQVGSLLQNELPAIVKNEIRLAMPDLVAAVKEGMAAQTNQPQESPAGPADQSAAPAAVPAGFSVGNLLSNPDALMQLVDKGLDRFFQFKEQKVLGDINANPLGYLNIIAQTNPQLMSLYAPNPWGNEFQQMLANSYHMGMKTKLGGEASKKAVEEAAKNGTPIELWPSPNAESISGPAEAAPTQPGPITQQPPSAEPVSAAVNQLSISERNSLALAAIS